MGVFKLSYKQIGEIFMEAKKSLPEADAITLAVEMAKRTPEENLALMRRMKPHLFDDEGKYIGK